MTTRERAAVIRLREGSSELAFTFDEMLRYHGGGSPGGVAHAFKVLERGLARLSGGRPVERRELEIDTAFRGPGARDAFELAARVVSDRRYTIEPALARSDLGVARERFVFRLRYRGESVVLTLRDGFVTLEFIELTRRDDRTPEQESQLTAMKAAMAARVMATDAVDVYDAS